MSFLSQQQLAQDADFRLRVRNALAKAAINVCAEAPETTNHTNRCNFATLALRDPERYGDVVAQGVVTNAVITAESADDAIEFTVNSMFNAYAGVI
jgi:hypothetical protein